MNSSFLAKVVVAVGALLLPTVGLMQQAPPAETAGARKPKLSPERAAEARRTIVAYLECEECTEGELAAVVKLGQVAVPSLADTLREGLAPAKREDVRHHLQNTYRQLKAYQEKRPATKVASSEEEYVQMYLDNTEALYRIRAAQALAAIGGPEARKALTEAANRRWRDDVTAAIRAALQKVK